MFSIGCNTLPMEAILVNSSQFHTVTQFANKFPCFSPASLRWLLFNRSTNGLDRAIVQIGRRVLIDEAAFVEWLRSHGGGGATGIGQ